MSDMDGNSNEDDVSDENRNRHSSDNSTNINVQNPALISDSSLNKSSMKSDNLQLTNADSSNIQQLLRNPLMNKESLDNSQVSNSSKITSTRHSLLPWGLTSRNSLIGSVMLPFNPSTAINVENNMRPGEIVMRNLFTEFTYQAERKIEAVLLETPDKNLARLLQRGEDQQFDQLLSAFGSVAEHCLPSLLNILLAWHRRQILDIEIKTTDMVKKQDIKSMLPKPQTTNAILITDMDFLLQRREASVEFIFCLALIEILKQLQFHPGHEDIIKNIENLAFKHFKFREGLPNNPNAHNIHMISDLYAEVIGVLAQSRFVSVKKRFMTELMELRAKEPSPQLTQSIISLLMGMKFFRVKMVPIEEFEASFQFMHECAQYFLEVKDKDIKHALAGLFVEILVPVAAAVKNEVNVPCVKNFVDLLYMPTLDASQKSKHKLALFPLITCLLCVSQKSFFLNNWHYFLASCLNNLKNRDAKMSRVALESLYRLLWVYMIRIKCESNSATNSRLQSIVNSLFPKGSKGVIPRDTPLNIFVKIIQFIAQERLDFAMKEIVYDLLSVGRQIKMILTPERMSIGLRAFLVVADSLQQKDGEPPMPRAVGVLPSGNTLRVKKTYINKMLTDETAKSIGMQMYFPHVRRVFVEILHALDVHIGRPLMMTNSQNQNKEPFEILTADRKPKIDLFRTCVAAVPRLIPDSMTPEEFVDLLSRLTVHMDEELRMLSHQSLQTLVLDFPHWRQDVVHGYTQFLVRDVVDTFPHLLEVCTRALYLFLNIWKGALTNASTNTNNSSGSTMKTTSTNTAVSTQMTTIKENVIFNARTNTNTNSSGSASILSSSSLSTQFTVVNSTETSSKKQEIPLSTTLHFVEGFALVLLCNCKPFLRKSAANILKEVKNLMKALNIATTEPPLIDVIDKCCPYVLEKCLPHLPQTEKTAILNANCIDLQWIADRTSSVWLGSSDSDSSKSSTINLNTSSAVQSSQTQFDAWATCLFGFVEKNNLLQACPSAISQAWPILYLRVTALYAVIDPTPVNDNRASLLRSSAPTKKIPTESQKDLYLRLWKNQVALAMRIVPPIPSIAVRCASPELSLSLQDQSDSRSLSDSLDNIPSNVFGPEGLVTRFTLPLSYGRKEARQKRLGSSPDSMNADRSDKYALGPASPLALYKLIVPLLRCEVVDIRDAAVNALGMINHDALKDLIEELVVYIREAVDRKQENMRRRRRRDALRLQLVRVLEKIAENGIFGESSCVLDRDSLTLHHTFVEYIEGARLYLESEIEKDNANSREVKIHFCNFIRKMIKNFTLESCATLLSMELKKNLFNLFTSWCGSFAKPLGIITNAEDSKLEFSSLQAMSALLCCGPIFDSKYLADDGVLYKWLDSLLSSKDEKVYKLAKDTIVLLLESNPDIGQLLEWIIDRCYTSPPREADACFLSLAAIFSAREYPCDHYTSVINVTLLMTGCPRIDVHTTALQLLQVLDNRFFGSIRHLHVENQNKEDEINQDGTLDTLLSNAYSRSQRFLSKQMAQLRPELTMSMFSEITNRFQTAREEVRNSLLQCVLPWLENMELVATSVPPATPLSYIMYFPDSGTRGRKEGSGSSEATEMILNNLFYITIKFSDTHSRSIEELWGTLCEFWPNNLKVILRYLVIISGMAPNELLCHTKRVALYLARTCPDRLLDELMTELQTVETLNCLIERTATPPYYRLTSMRKVSGHSEGQATGMNDTRIQDLMTEKGTIHTKRHSGEDPIKMGTCKSDSGIRAFTQNIRPSRGADKIRAASGPSILPRPEDIIFNESEIKRDEGVELRADIDSAPIITAPHPLPMPEYGGYFAPLTEFLPDISTPITGFHRCNVAVMLLTDIVIDGIPGIDWTLHLPLMLHISFLGLDHNRAIVRDHCKQLCMNLLIVLSEHNDNLAVARILLNSNTTKLQLGLSISSINTGKHNFTESNPELDNYLFGIPQPQISQISKAKPTNTISKQSQSMPQLYTTLQSSSTIKSNSNQINTSNIKPSNGANLEVNPNTSENSEIPLIVAEDVQQPNCMSISCVIKGLIEFLSNENVQPLWNYEDITAKVWVIKSAEQLSCFLRYIVKVFAESYPQARIPERWAQLALQLGLSCSSRHYAGRCLQIFRALNVPINSRMLSEILSRLVETVAEQGEDMQGYVTELLLTLESAVDSLDSDFRPLDVMKDIFKSTPNLNNKDGGPNSVLPTKKSPSGTNPLSQVFGNLSHVRSTSYSVTISSKKTSNSQSDKQAELRNRSSGIELDRNSNKFGSVLLRSRSAQSLKMLGDSATQDDKMTILSQLFWLSVCLLESDYEHEFLLALRLLTRVLHRLPLDRPDARDKVEKLQQQLKWSSYPGVHALLLKGCTHASTYEPTIIVLSQLATLLTLPVCDPTQSWAFPMNVISLLPYMLLHFEDANEVCIRSAENIAQVSSELGVKLENLGTVMTLYSRKTFCKESFQWTKCVVKYLYDTYALMGLHMLAFLIEVLEKGPQQIQVPVLNIIHCMLHYVDLTSNQAQSISADILKVVGKYLDTPNWKEALKILKLIVTRSSSLQVAPPSADGSTGELSFHFYSAYPDVDFFTKKELAGRTMEFTFDVSQTPIIGRRILLKSDNEVSSGLNSKSSTSSSNIGKDNNKTNNGNSNINIPSSNATESTSSLNGNKPSGNQLSGTPNSPRRSASLSPADSVPISGWKRPWMSQGRVRECLVNLLTTCGQSVGLPKSPSVIFSQSSDLMERQSSAASSTEETSGGQPADLSGGSRRDEAHPDFGVFRDFDFLEYESESLEGESTDNFNWGVRRRPLSEVGETEPCVRCKSHSNFDDSHSDRTPILNKRKRQIADDSSDDELESESPIDDDHRISLNKSSYHVCPPSTLSLRERKRRDSVSRSDTSGSSVGDLGDITPCNASPHLPGINPFHPIRDEVEDNWRKQLQALLINQPSTHASDLVHQLYKLVKELTTKTISVSKESRKYFTGFGSQLGSRISIFADHLATRADPPKVWCNNIQPTTPRLFETLRYNVLEVQEHLETFFDRKDNVMVCLDAVNVSSKLSLLVGIESSTDSNNVFDNSTEMVIDLGRSLYKLFFQLLLLIESNHKIAVSIINNFRQNEQMQDLSDLFMLVRKSLSRYVEDVELESFDTSTSTEGEHTPTPSPQIPQTYIEYEATLQELISQQKWSQAIYHIRNYKRVVLLSSSNPNISLLSPDSDPKMTDEILTILNCYSKQTIRDRNDAFIVSKTEQELSELYSILTEDLYNVSSALTNMEINLKSCYGSGQLPNLLMQKDSDDLTKV